jgi:hypothetical protein
VTVLIATRKGVWADRRVTGGNGMRYRPARKVVAGVALVAGFCGASSDCQRAIEAVASGETDVKALAKLSDGLVVTTRGTVWELYEGVAARLPRAAAFATHGSGFSEAQAFLSGTCSHDAKAVRRALSYVAQVRCDCGDGYDYLPSSSAII